MEMNGVRKRCYENTKKMLSCSNVYHTCDGIFDIENCARSVAIFLRFIFGESIMISIII